MSRSNPGEGKKAPNICKRWIEWNGSQGRFEYYDREKEKKIEVPLPLTVLVLDCTATVTGWDDESDSKVYSSEVRDLNQPLTVKSFKGGEIAVGPWSAIRDKVKARGGKFTQNIYSAVKDGDELILACVQFAGAALKPWLDFRNDNKNAIDTDAVKIASYVEGKKGSIKYRVPVFELVPVSAETNELARGIDKQLQSYLNGTVSENSTRGVGDATGEAAKDSDLDSDIPF